MNNILNKITKIIFLLVGAIICIAYFSFENKKDFSYSSTMNREEKNRKTNFTKITKFLYNSYIFLVIFFIISLFFVSKEMIS